MTTYFLKSEILENGGYNHKLLDGKRHVLTEGEIDDVRGRKNLPDSTVLEYMITAEAELSRRRNVLQELEIKFKVAQKFGKK